MLFDLSTLLAIIVFTSAVAGCLLLLSWLQHRGTPALAMWGGTFVLNAASAALIAARGDISDVWSIAIANALLALAYGVLWSGVRSFENQRVSVGFTLAGAIIWLAACTTDTVYAQPSVRATIIAVILIAYLLLALFELWRARSEALMSRWPIMVLLAVHAGLMPIRIPLAASLSGVRPVGGDLLAFVTFEAVFISMCAAYLFGSVVNERIALQYKNAALSDPLTGVANRRAFLDQGARIIRRSRHACRPVALLLFDLDRFKSINDEFGHQAGDGVIATFSRVATAVLRPDDLFARIGGEEFACLLPDTPQSEALSLAERVRSVYAGTTHDIASRVHSSTVSVGVATTTSSVVDLTSLLASADTALYRAKAKGRNCVETAATQ